MKKIYGWTALAVAIAGTMAAAQVTPGDHSAHQPPVAGDSSRSAAGAPPPAVDEMQAGMRTMQQQMEKIHASRDPAERQALLKQHMEAMQRHMDLMQGMQGGAMGCGSMMGGMGMMQSMLGQMRQHLEAEQKQNPAGK